MIKKLDPRQKLENENHWNLRLIAQMKRLEAMITTQNTLAFFYVTFRKNK